MDKQTQQNLLNLVKRNYEEIAEHYSETRKKHLMPLWGQLVDFAQEVKNNSKIMDVGCGNGRLLEAFKNKQIHYLGVDDNEKLLNFAKSRHPDFRFTKGNILELSKIPDIDYDYIFCTATLHHLPGNDLRIAALKQIKNKIKSDGKIIITVWNLWSQTKFRKLIWKFILLKLIGKNKMDVGDILFDWKNSKGDRVSQRYYYAFTKCGLKKIARKAGLKIEKVYKDQYNYYMVLRK